MCTKSPNKTILFQQWNNSIEGSNTFSKAVGRFPSDAPGYGICGCIGRSNLNKPIEIPSLYLKNTRIIELYNESVKVNQRMKEVSDSFIQKNKKINQSYRHYEDLQIDNSAEIILFLETTHNRKEGIAIFFSTNNRDRKGEILVGVVVPNIITDHSQNP